MDCGWIFWFSLIFPILQQKLRDFLFRYLLLHVSVNLTTLEQYFAIHNHRAVGYPPRDPEVPGRSGKLSYSACDTISSLVIPRAWLIITMSLFCSTNLSTNGMQAETVRQNSSQNYPKSPVQSKQGTFQYSDNTQCAEVESMTHPTVYPQCESPELGRNLIPEIFYLILK